MYILYTWLQICENAVSSSIYKKKLNIMNWKLAGYSSDFWKWDRDISQKDFQSCIWRL
jgi:hypothetical protein